ncbi:hypothetical protein LguiB_017306 [Lonicera macranthoides]
MDHSQKPDSYSTLESWHQHTLNSQSVDHDQETPVYSYSQVMHGFIARLTPSQVAQLDTSPTYQAMLRVKSFSNNDMSPVPEQWKAIVRMEQVLALLYEDDYDSTRDFNGHGTYTASIAGSNCLLGTSHFGYISGMARGVALGAHIAVYKMVWATSTNEFTASDVLAGMDQAIADWVNILYVSLGFQRTSYFKDVIAIASLSAIEKGIFVACAAGNIGPAMNTTLKGAPWIITMGAQTIDRTFVATLNLGNRQAKMTLKSMRPYMKSGIYDLVNDYMLVLGTSMATPHLAGVAALIKG